jgi:hypothetical protein
LILKEIEQEIDLIKKQLTLLNLYPDDFQKVLGNDGVKTFIDNRLDRLIVLQKLRK